MLPSYLPRPPKTASAAASLPLAVGAGSRDEGRRRPGAPGLVPSPGPSAPERILVPLAPRFQGQLIRELDLDRSPLGATLGSAEWWLRNLKQFRYKRSTPEYSYSLTGKLKTALWIKFRLFFYSLSGAKVTFRHKTISIKSLFQHNSNYTFCTKIDY
jgi:hypothetical protein